MDRRATLTTARPRHQDTRQDTRQQRLPAYAKLTPPRLHAALPRPRLFALLDDLRRDHPVIWLAAPPGAGKTTLAASYLARIAAPAIWLQVDAGDADPATLFFFLDEAARGLALAGPVRTYGHRADKGGSLARAYFRTFYARLPPGTVLVLDNLHEADWDRAGELLASALAEVPAQVTVLALGREAPPARLARMELEGRLARLGWDALRLDEDEARALAGLGAHESAPAQEWLRLADGWATGIAMLRSLGASGCEPGLPLDGRDALFRYFAGEIVDRLPARSQHLLLQLSCLPNCPGSDAAQLTGDPPPRACWKTCTAATCSSSGAAPMEAMCSTPCSANSSSTGHGRCWARPNAAR
ncbi:hypothetical protein [Massilia sp. Se16.2.3]|uniref:hypothetical protein n=1 Tax=Massilia sp. Se16.2.3 TaxID=2709303 RepID=UPI0015FF8461|nr:hypothetical protein [Massilia sp. Se16.2.3]QNA99905.1 hypothetical protein G4G31_15600 [Massilia sp. Se16.2.3]